MVNTIGNYGSVPRLTISSILSSILYYIILKLINFVINIFTKNKNKPKKN